MEACNGVARISGLLDFGPISVVVIVNRSGRRTGEQRIIKNKKPNAQDHEAK